MKALAKKLFAFHDIRYPKFSIMEAGHVEWADELRFPLFVKPSNTDSSVGIDGGALVRNVKELMERISFVHSEDAKWNKRSKAYRAPQRVPADVPEEVRARIQAAAVDACRALRILDYGRVDLRLRPPDGEGGEWAFYVIEVNPNPYLDQRDEVALAAAAQGKDFAWLCERIIELATTRNVRAAA